MVQAGMGGLDTPRTNLGDATYLSNQQLDFDISQEQSFQSPSKDNNNLVQQLQNGRRGAINLRTPRSRVALGDKRNLPAGLGGGEFTPLLKSATRNSALRNGKENTIQTPAFLRPGGLDNIPEDLSPLPIMDSSRYGDSRNGSYMVGTPAPHIDTSSTASTPMALLPRRNEGPGVLQDGNQLSLREQENVIDRIEKENFGLKLKIHFLEEALRKAGPGFSEAALKENTDLKVDKVTMQKELIRYRKTLTSAERDVDLYRQQLLEMQEKIKRKHVNEGQREEIEHLRQILEERENELNRLRSEEARFEDMEDKIQDLEAELRERDRAINDREDEVDKLKDEVEKQAVTIAELESLKDKARRRAMELEEQAQASEELEEAKETIQELEQHVQHLRNEAEDAKEDCREAVKEKERAEADLEELQDEMANKSITTKGLSRQIEEKANRLQDDLEDLKEKYVELEEKYEDKIRDTKKFQDRIDEMKQESGVREQQFRERLEKLENDKDSASQERESVSKRFELLRIELHQKGDEKDLLQTRHDALTTESAGLQKDLTRSRKTIEDLEDKLDHEKTLALENERHLRNEFKSEIEKLNDEIEDLRAEIREKERRYDDDGDKWANERRKLETHKDNAEQRASDLQQTIDRLQQAEGTLSGNETKLQEALQNEKARYESQEALLSRQIDELNEDVQARRKTLDEVRSELSNVREDLRHSQREQKALTETIEALEDEVELLQTNLDEESNQAKENLATTKVESEDLRKQLQALKEDLARAKCEAIDAHAEVETFQGNLKAGEGSVQHLTARLKDVDAQLSKVRQDKQGLQDQLATLNIEVHSLRVSKADVEAERHEFHSQLTALKQQEDETFRLDQERMELRTAKIKLDGEVRRLREENKAAIAQQQTVERELQEEIDRAGAEEARLQSEILDLQRILRGSAEKRELAAAKKTIQQMEERVRELEAQIASSGNHDDSLHELSMIRRDLSAARQKETEFIQREATQKELLRSLKRQIMDLERKAHDAEVSRFVSASPQSSISGSASKSEIIEVRAQLASAHQNLKELRGQLRDAEKESARKLSAANLELQNQTAIWEAEKDRLEQSLDEARFNIEELVAKNTTSEATITRLRGKIERLEKALQTERLNANEDRSIVQERRDLHEMLRETQLQAESLEIVVQERENEIVTLRSTESDLRARLKRRDNDIATIRASESHLQSQLKQQENDVSIILAAESELRAQLKRLREERTLHRSKANSTYDQLHVLELNFKEAKASWEAEKKALCRGVRFPNTSLSVNDESQLAAEKEKYEEREKLHVKEMRGMTMQAEWLRARCKRAENFRDMAAYAKKYMEMRIEMFEACNRADIALLASAGIPVPPRKPKKKKTFRMIAWAIRSTVRMKMGVEQWKEKRKIHEKIMAKVESMKFENTKKQRRSIMAGR